MMASTNIPFLLLLVIHGSLQKSTPSSPTYRAAVVEFNPVYYKSDPERTMIEIGHAIVRYIELAAEKNVDIIVFPEESLQTVDHPVRSSLLPWSTEIPAPSQHYAVCNSSDTLVREVVKMVACAAKRNEIYVAINVLEREDCLGKNCPPDGLYNYITSVVFDRDGMIISRYRKSHLNDEPGLFDFLHPPVRETFNTDFGVTFGHIVCSDILFKNPWIDVARELNVTDFILEMAWDIRMPFSSGLQMQSGFSYAEDINLLAADYNSVTNGYSGSGIYAGRDGILTAIMTQGVHEEMLIADVPKKFGKAARPPTLFSDPQGRVRLIGDNQGYQIRNTTLRKNDGGPFYVQYESLEAYETKIISENGYVLEELSHSGIKCKFEVNVTNLSPPATYRLVAFGDKISGGYIFTLGFRICSIVSCLNDTLNSCGLIHNSSTIFESIAVTATYEYNENVIMTPNSLGSDLLPLSSWLFDSRREGDQEHTFMFLPKPVQGLLTFGLWGRNYNEDVMSWERNISIISSWTSHRYFTPFLDVTAIKVNVTNLSPPAMYCLVAFGDKLPVGPILKLGIRICSIVSCLNDTLSSCGLIQNSSTVFQSIAVTATYEYSENVIITPNSLGSNLLPLSSWVFDSRQEGNHEHTFMFSPKPVQGLLTFGVWGRNYDEDVTSSGRNISSKLLSLPILLIFLDKLSTYFL